jgi:hypothetical protein
LGKKQGFEIMFKIIADAIGIAARANDPRGVPALREQPPVVQPPKAWPRQG